MTMLANRLAALRAHLASEGLDGWLVPLTDEHMSEYVGAYARRLEWLTGFTGSAGSAVVLQDGRAAIFVDGRYTLQVAREVDARLYAIEPIPASHPGRWLQRQAPAGARIGYDPWLHTRVQLDMIAAAAPNIDLVPAARNAVDAVWPDRPKPSEAPAEPHADAFAGEGHEAKRRRLAEAIRAEGADAAVLASLDSVAWAFNIRGRDVHRTPVVRAFALLHADTRATLFLAPGKVTPELRQHLGPDVAIEPYEAVTAGLARLAGRRVLADPASTVAALLDALEAGGATVIERRDPALLPKACKNAVEAEGTRAAHRRDGLAVSRFLAWLDQTAPNAPIDELAAEARLEAIRRESNLLRDLSFDSISAYGPNGAFPHYRSTAETNRRLEPGNLYLIDSGGQYPDGTTDVTRTVAIGTPTPEMRDRFTRVLKGHIALATARFPKGTRGGQLDILARQHLWAAGLDYAHGTGHGVGSYLAVHEGPQRIAAAAGAPGIEEPLQPGMILSNEPGFYKVGGFGIRIENLVLVVEDQRATDSEPMLAFETLTLAPIDTRLVDAAMMTEAEIAWLDAYHARVWDTHAPSLEGEERAWLMAATAPLASATRQAA
jgi:Xaa-Pro aminopeptidase